MWRLTWHRAADAPQGEQEPLAPPAPAPQEGATTRPVLTESLLLAAISDSEKTRLLTELIKAASQADIDVTKAETECHKDLQKSQTEQLNSRFKNKSPGELEAQHSLLACSGPSESSTQ